LRKIVIDARGTEHPKPLEMAIDALRNMDRDSYLYMLNRKNPIPLLSLAKQHKFSVLSHEQSENEWHILICKDESMELDKLIEADIYV